MANIENGFRQFSEPGYSDKPDLVQPAHYADGRVAGFSLRFPHLHWKGDHLIAFVPIAAGALLAAVIFGN